MTNITELPRCISLNKSKETGRTNATISCNDCNNTKVHNVNGPAGGILPYQVIVNLFARAKWSVGTHNATCPICVEKTRQERAKQEHIQKLMSRQDKRNIFRALDRLFNENTDRFTLDVNAVDEQVAAQLHVPLRWVIEVRRQMFY